MDYTFSIHSVSELVIKCHAQRGWLMIFFELKQKLISGKWKQCSFTPCFGCDTGFTENSI